MLANNGIQVGVGIRLWGGGGNILNDPSYLEMEAVQIIHQLSNSGSVSVDITSQPLLISNCTYDSYDISDEIIDNFSLTSFYWMDDDEYKLQGDIANPNFKSLQLRIKKCTNKDYWKSDDEIDEYLSLNSFYTFTALQSSYLDIQSYEDPVKPQVEGKLFWKITPGMHKSHRVSLTQNEFNSYDSIFGYSSGSNSEFYSVGDIYSDYTFENEDKTLLTLELVLDNKIVKYERQVMTIATMVSKIGGFFEFFLRIFFMLTSIFGAKKYISYLSNNLFLVPSNVSKVEDQRKVHSMLESSNNITKFNLRNTDVSVSDIEFSESNSNLI